MCGSVVRHTWPQKESIKEADHGNGVGNDNCMRSWPFWERRKTNLFILRAVSHIELQHTPLRMPLTLPLSLPRLTSEIQRQPLIEERSTGTMSFLCAGKLLKLIHLCMYTLHAHVKHMYIVTS